MNVESATHAPCDMLGTFSQSIFFTVRLPDLTRSQFYNGLLGLKMVKSHCITLVEKDNSLLVKCTFSLRRNIPSAPMLKHYMGMLEVAVHCCSGSRWIWNSKPGFGRTKVFAPSVVFQNDFCLGNYNQVRLCLVGRRFYFL